MADPQIPPPAAGGPLILLKAKTYSLIRKGLMRAILPDTNDFEVERSVASLKFRIRKENTLGKLILIGGSEPLKFQVTPGTVNDEMPTMDAVALDAADPPETAIAVTTWFYIKVIGSFGTPDSYAVTIHTETSAAAPTPDISSTGFTSYKLIGKVEVVDDVGTIVSNRSGGDLRVDSFGSANFWWLV